MSQSSKPAPLATFKRYNLIFFRAMVGAYGLYITLYSIAVIVISERLIFMEFLNTFAQIMFLPSLLLFPICIIMREWRLASMILPACIGFIWMWGAFFIPGDTVILAESDIAFRYLSYNLNAGNFQTDAYTDAIRAVDADIVALQEVNFHHARALIEAFADVYPFIEFHPGGTPGMGIMSRYPIVEDSYWQYDFLLNTLGHQRAVIEIVPDIQFIIYNVHPTHPGMQGQLFNPEFRSREIADLLNRTAQETVPVILAGDFNMPDFSEDYRAIRTQFSDAHRTTGTGFGWTFPDVHISGQSIAFLRIDYIFYDDHFAVQEINTWSSNTGSDHRGLYADLLFRG